MALWQSNRERLEFYEHALMRIALHQKVTKVDIDLVAEMLETTRTNVISALRNDKFTKSGWHLAWYKRTGPWIIELSSNKKNLSFIMTIEVMTAAKEHAAGDSSCYIRETRQWNGTGYDVSNYCLVDVPDLTKKRKGKLQLSDIQRVLTVTG